jgi:hypothetical protein
MSDNQVGTGLEQLLTPVPALDNVLRLAAAASSGDAVKVDLLFVRFKEDKPKLNELAEVLFHELINYCIPKKKLAEERRRARENGEPDTTLHMRLFAEARRAFIKYNRDLTKKNANTRYAEVGELLAYCVAIHYLRAAQIAAKMALKTNSEMPVFGLDGIHARAESDGTLTVFYLESKMTKDAESGSSQYADSAAKFEHDRKHELNELRIARDLSNLDAIEGPAREAALNYFNPYSTESAQVRERYVGVIAHTEALYEEKLAIDDDTPVTIHETTFCEKYRALHSSRVITVRNHLEAEGVSLGKARAFFVAVPSVDQLKALFATEMSGE